MPIMIGDTYKVESNELNVILSQRTNPSRKGQGGKWRDIGYFGTPQNALEHLVNLGVNRTELKDLETVCGRIDELKGMIQEALSGSRN